LRWLHFVHSLRAGSDFPERGGEKAPESSASSYLGGLRDVGTTLSGASSFPA
jgi:hypothetical protein